MGAGLVGQLCLAARWEKGVRRPSIGSNRSRLNTGKPSYLMKSTQSTFLPLYEDTKCLRVNKYSLEVTSIRTFPNYQQEELIMNSGKVSGYYDSLTKAVVEKISVHKILRAKHKCRIQMAHFQIFSRPSKDR